MFFSDISTKRILNIHKYMNVTIISISNEIHNVFMAIRINESFAKCINNNYKQPFYIAGLNIV